MRSASSVSRLTNVRPLAGNHDFDFGSYFLPCHSARVDRCAHLGSGYPHLTTLIGDTHFVRLGPILRVSTLPDLRTLQPWLLSNIVDENTGKVPEGLKEYFVIERAGVRIGVIGLVEA